ncbi:MAG: tetratricopeptide repeat protein [Candidatus Hydrogenedentes bacterium]|nr:tetratricopeptide repeat protein [Candidatus Hydrogenedentota bacterium]
MSDEITPQKQRRALIVAALLCGLSFLLFMPFGLYLTRLVRDSRDYSRKVPQYLDAGKIDRAVTIARLASEREPAVPAARHWYARALMRAGKREQALEEYTRLFSMRSVSVANPTGDIFEAAPATSPTQRPFFYPEARCDLGKFWLEQDDPWGAVDQFELARAFGEEPSPECVASLKDAYARAGLWDSLFAVAAPTSEEIRGLSGSALEALARRAIFDEDWALCRAAGEILGQQEDLRVVGQLFEGIARFASGDFDAAFESLTEATRLGSPDASFFLGLTCEARGIPAENHFLATPSTSLYRPFAVAKVIKLLRDRLALPGPAETPVSIAEPAGAEPPVGDQNSALRARLKGLEQELHHIATRATTIPKPTRSTSTGLRPAGIEIPPDCYDFSGPFRVLVKWYGDYFAGGAEPTIFKLDTRKIKAMRLAFGNTVLELRWVENLAPFGDFQSFRDDSPVFPGWPALYRKQHSGELREGMAAGAVSEEHYLRLVSRDPNGIARCSSVCVPVQFRQNYLLAVRCQSESAKLFAGWTWYDGEDRAVLTHNVVNQRTVSQWSWHTEYLEQPENAAYVQANLGIYQDQGAALFGAVLIIPLDPPAVEVPGSIAARNRNYSENPQPIEGS